MKLVIWFVIVPNLKSSL